MQRLCFGATLLKYISLYTLHFNLLRASDVEAVPGVMPDTQGYAHPCPAASLRAHRAVRGMQDWVCDVARWEEARQDVRNVIQTLTT